MTTWKEALEAIKNDIKYTNELKDAKIPLVPELSPKSIETRDFIAQIHKQRRKHK